nr:unnamed protein product [Digitaria exilis]
MGNTACCRARSATVASSPPRVPDWTEVVPLFREGVRGHPTVDDRYASKGTLGSGGFGVVWLAVSRSSEPGPRRRVACKSIRWRNLRKPEAVEDLRRELSIMASLPRRHPAMVRLHEVYEDESAVHMVMDLCDGGSLSDRMDIIRRSSEAYCTETLERAAARVAWELVEAVRALHAAGIMHRDLKPDNLMFSGHGDEERLKVIDFGFAIDFRPGGSSSSEF